MDFGDFVGGLFDSGKEMATAYGQAKVAEKLAEAQAKAAAAQKLAEQAATTAGAVGNAAGGTGTKTQTSNTIWKIAAAAGGVILAVVGAVLIFKRR